MLTEISVVASDDETFEKYGDEIDFNIEVEWDESTISWKSDIWNTYVGPTGILEEFVDAKLKQAKLDGELMPLTEDLEKFAIKKLREGWFKATNTSNGYSGEILDIRAEQQRQHLEDCPEVED
jgi:hypothetical protein